eukprot:gene9224-biopygen13747
MVRERFCITPALWRESTAMFRPSGARPVSSLSLHAERWRWGGGESQTQLFAIAVCHPRSGQRAGRAELAWRARRAMCVESSQARHGDTDAPPPRRCECCMAGSLKNAETPCGLSIEPKTSSACQLLHS